MRRILAPVMVAAALSAPSLVSAQTSLTSQAQFSPGTSVVYITFRVAVAGTFRLQTSGLAAIDPWMWLFTGKATEGSQLGVALAQNDDGAPASAGFNRCTGASGTCHALLNVFLGPGDYTIAVSVAILTEAQARAGVQSPFGLDLNYGAPLCNADGNWSDCNYDVGLSSLDGVATTVVPEPMTIILLGTGLAGIGGAIRRRRNHLS